MRTANFRPHRFSLSYEHGRKRQEGTFVRSSTGALWGANKGEEKEKLLMALLQLNKSLLKGSKQGCLKWIVNRHNQRKWRLLEGDFNKQIKLIANLMFKILQRHSTAELITRGIHFCQGRKLGSFCRGRHRELFKSLLLKRGFPSFLMAFIGTFDKKILFLFAKTNCLHSETAALSSVRSNIKKTCSSMQKHYLECCQDKGGRTFPLSGRRAEFNHRSQHSSCLNKVLKNCLNYSGWKTP